MEELINQLATENASSALAKLTTNTIDTEKVVNLRKEFHDIDRDQRKTQIGQIQKDKRIGKGENAKYIQGVRIPIPIQNKIVTTATAFEVGEPVTLMPTILKSEKKSNNLTDEIKRLWKSNRVDHVIQKAIQLQKSELQCAVLFYIKDMNEDSWLNKLVGINTKKEIKIDLLENKNGKMTPVFDSFGDMQAFVWEFDQKTDSKTIKNAWVYTEKFVIKLDNKEGGKITQESKELHGFGKIPVVYFSQEKPEWHVSEKMIDRLEVSMSKLGASNDYSGHPILKLYGEVQGAPDKDEDGKALRFNMVEDEDNPGKLKHGDASFLTHDNAPESVKLELDRLEKYIYSLTSCPDLSLENLKSIGDISAKAIKLLFIDAIIKAKMNEGDNRTAIERMINVFISGTVSTTATSLKSEARNTFFEIQFNSILPDDLKETVETYASAVNAKIMSVRKAVESLDMVQDVDTELEEIGKNPTEKKPEPSNIE